MNKGCSVLRDPFKQLPMCIDLVGHLGAHQAPVDAILASCHMDLS